MKPAVRKTVFWGLAKYAKNQIEESSDDNSYCEKQNPSQHGRT